MIIFDGRGAHLFTLESVIAERYVISLKIIFCSKQRKDLLLRNKFEETVFFLVKFWQTLFVFISNPLSNC